MYSLMVLGPEVETKVLAGLDFSEAMVYFVHVLPLASGVIAVRGFP